MRAYNVMWARAKAAEEITNITSRAEQRIHDIQERISRAQLQTPTIK